jgi:hypothetical protein
MAVFAIVRISARPAAPERSEFSEAFEAATTVSTTFEVASLEEEAEAPAAAPPR